MKNVDEQKPAKRPLFRFWPIVVLALLPIIPLWRCVFLGQAIGPFDQIAQMAPWHGPKPAQPWDVLQADGVLQFYPWRDMVFKAWGHGQLPLWNPYELAGTPLLGNSQSAGFYPPHVILGLLHVPTQLGMTLLAWFHLFWTGLGTFLLARRFGASKEGALIAGASFELSAFMIAWTGLPSVITTVAWIPWLLAGVKGVYELQPLRIAVMSAASEKKPMPPDENPSTTANQAQALANRSIDSHRRYLGATVTVAISAGMMILAGHLQFVAYGFMSAALLALWLMVESCIELRDAAKNVTVHSRTGSSEVLHTRHGLPLRHQPWLGSSFRIVLAMLIGAAIAAPQLLPVLNYSQFSHRRNDPTEAGYSGYAAAAIQPFEFLGLAFPKLVGDPGDWVPDIDMQGGLPSYWPQYIKRGANFAEGALAIGPVVLLLLCTLVFRRPAWKKVLPLAAIGFLGLLLAMGSPLTRATYFLIPGWSSTGSPGRAIVLFVLAACVMAAFAVRTDDEPATTFDLKQLAPIGLFLGVSLVFVLLIKTALSDISSPSQGGLSDLDAVIQLADREPLKLAMVVALLTAVGGAFWLFRGKRAFWAVLVLTAISPALLLGGILRFGDPTSLSTSGPEQDRIAVINSDWGIVNASPALLPPNTAAISAIHELGGYDSLIHRETVKLLEAIDGKDPATLTNGNMMFVKPSADPAKLEDAGVSEVWSTRSLENLGVPTSTEGGINKYKLAGPGRASTPTGPAQILGESYSQLKVAATGPGRLVVRDRNMPGWIAKVDGRHVPIEGDLWRELDLPAGNHVVEFNYVPPGLMTGIYVAVPAWLILLGCSIIVWKRPPNPTT